MHLVAEAVVIAVRPHGEHGAVVRALTPADGVQAGYVRGGRSRRLRPVLVPGNRIKAEFRARTGEQLAHLSAELVHSRAFLLSEPLAAAAIEWTCALAAATLPESQPYPRLFVALEGLMAAIEAAPSARGWSAALVRYELTLLAEVGFGIDSDRLGALPPGLFAGSGDADWDSVGQGLRLTGRRLARDVLIERRSDLLAARDRLVARLERALA
ncbi:MAG: DNA repair protein RecO [Sphingosinicella sp.]